MRTQFYNIKVAEGTVLSRSGDGHVLVYSKDGDYYYSVSLADLFKKQNSEINAMKEDIEAFEDRLEKSYDEKVKDLEEKDAERDAKVNELQKNYKENMSKVVTMVEAMMKGEN